MSLQTQLSAGFARLVSACNVLAGRCLPAGGIDGQMLIKETAANYQAAWRPAPARAAKNQSAAAQALTAATLTYLVGSALALPAAGLVVGSCYRWTYTLAKTAAGTATSTINIKIGTLGTTADATVLTFTKPVGTAAVDTGKIVLDMVVRSTGTAGVVVGDFSMNHNLANTGHMTIPGAAAHVVSATFNTTAATVVGLAMTTGAADVCTIQLCMAEAWGL